MGINISEFFDRQLQVWDTARNNFEALKNVKVKEFNVDGTTIKVQFNPGRIVSSAAKVDAKSLKERKCFLCAANRPAVQEGIAWGDDYTILINPFPIFPRHLTIPCNEHVDQLIKGRIADMMNLSRDLEGFTLFYNGPKCGASAPDHRHFQAGNRGLTPPDGVGRARHHRQRRQRRAVDCKGNVASVLLHPHVGSRQGREDV